MEEQNKHRDWLKRHEGLRFLRNAEQGNTNRKWELDYNDNKYDPTINLIEIEKKELIIEYDETSKIKDSNKKSTKDQREKWMQEIINKVEKENIKFELHDHKGKCPHLTLFLNKDATKEEKESIMKHYASEESKEFLDTSLCGIHLIAVPYVKHWKYGTIKELVKSGGEQIINTDDGKFNKNINNKNKEFIVKNIGGITAKIVSRIKISDLAMEYGMKKGTGTKLYHCGFHDDKKPSLSLNDKKGFFKCFGCDKSGNIIDFVSECENISKEDAIIKLKERADIIDYRKRKEFFGDEIMQLREDVLLNLAAHHTRDATELLCEYLEKHENIYVTRDDIKAEVWIYKEGIYVPNGKTYVKEFCREILGEAYTPHIANEVINKIETDNYIDAKEFFNSENVEEIPVQNGVLNIITSELKPFTPKNIFFNKLPIKYDSTKECPSILKFLSQVLRNDSDIPIVEELFGYCLLKDYRIQKAFMFNGSGANGKGRILELLKRFLGPENCVNIPLQDFEKDNFAISLLHGKLANISGDLGSQALDYTGNFKMLTGGDIISANRKFLSRITFTNYSKQIYSANQLPRTYDLTPAFFRRWILIDFPFTFWPEGDYHKLTDAEKKEKIGEKLKYRIADPIIIEKIICEDELSGILNKALEGLKRLLSKKDFSYSKGIADVKNMWIRKSDSFQAFCMDWIESDSQNIISKAELRHAYSEYCNQHKITSVGDRAIKETLNRAYGAVDDRKVMQEGYITVWKGIKLKELEGSE
jgi:P4 family phage/plasmid primase-like protien